jgi:bilirubin oxidase
MLILQAITMTFINAFIAHASWDGWASNIFCPNQYMDYYYPNAQSARTLWYHGHADHHTSKSAYYGIGGFWIIDDQEADSLGLPTGNYDIPLLINARQYQSDGQLFWKDGALIYGDVIEVNGQPWPYLSVEPRKYRFRMLDAAIARAFLLYIEDDAGNSLDFQVVGSDGGFLSEPVTTTSLSLSMGERWEVVVDFSNYANQNLTLMNTRHIQEDADYAATNQVMRFVVGENVSDSSNDGVVPNQLAQNSFPVSNGEPDQRFVFMLGGNKTNPTEWTINGVTFDDPQNRILANPALGSVETWEITNGGGGLHPVHVHLVEFHVISRTGGFGNGVRDVLPYEAAAWKDVVYVGEGETVQVVAKFAPWAGVYMFHCHNLVHEDHAMMDAFNVSSLTDFGYPQTLEFQDPEDPRFLARDVQPDIYGVAAAQSAVSSFAALHAYGDAASIYSAINANTVATPTPSVTASASVSFGAGSFSYTGGPNDFSAAVPSYTAFPSSGPAATPPPAISESLDSLNEEF